jgi:hypothetical protein
MWAPDEQMMLQEYIAAFYPNGPLTVTSLRTEINKGRLTFSEVAGKFFVTPAAVSALFRPKQCPDIPKGLGSISDRVGSITGQESASPMSTSSETDRLRKAQAVALTACQTLKKPSTPISPPNGRRRREQPSAEVIRPRF